MKKVFFWVGGITGVIGLIVAMLWGVPYYIESQVKIQIDALHNDQTPAEVVTLTAQMKSVEAGLLRVETKVDSFNLLFVGYLERQAQ